MSQIFKSFTLISKEFTVNANYKSKAIINMSETEVYCLIIGISERKNINF